MTIKEVSEMFQVSQDTLRYYERVGMIPNVSRTAAGIRDYQEKDIQWVEMAICMRNAGLPIEGIIEYVRLFQIGDTTIQARLELLKEQRSHLEKQKQQIETMVNRLDYKIQRYEQAVITGKLSWEE